MLVISGCSTTTKESFTFQADIPDNFTVDATAYYVPAPGVTCKDPSGKERQGPGRVFFKSERPRGTKPIEFKVPLTDTAHGCSTVLDSLGLDVEGQWGQRDLDMSKSFKGLSISNETSVKLPRLPASEPLVFEGQCQWYFRTVGSQRFIRKILKCGSLHTHKELRTALINGSLPRDQLTGKTVKLVLTEEEKEKPYYRGWWHETPEGWKACTGLWGTNNEEPCIRPYKFLKSFKMPDGRSCTVYPNCNEQGSK
ncbi:hypothetical protein J1D76_18625 [Pseudomonas sp. NFX15]